MSQIGTIKSQLEKLQNQGLIKTWEMPYEHLVTRLTAAKFFVEPAQEGTVDQIWEALKVHPRFTYQVNEHKNLSTLPWLVQFNEGFEL